MKSNNEINALLQLLDDPDDEIYESVSEKILHYGHEIIPNLESMWEHTTDMEVQERIENLIHKVNFNAVFDGFKTWFQAEKPSLLTGAILMSRFNFADIDETELRKTIKRVYQSCWLELNNYLTPLEQINIVNSIFYSMYKFKGFELDANIPNHFFINEVVQSKMGNNYSLGIVYQILCEMLDIPVYMVQLPRQCLLAYYDALHDFFNLEKNPVKKIQFYIDPSSGAIYSQNDVNAYLNKYELEANEYTYLPLSNKDIVCNSLAALSFVYEEMGEHFKHDELNKLVELRYKY